ncbi:hypothetical protein DXG01_002548 [Tephrocybe rancida]|nr:hypothetical protein DXG01_002548 [Tephrocybe rancida]
MSDFRLPNSIDDPSNRRLAVGCEWEGVTSGGMMYRGTVYASYKYSLPVAFDRMLCRNSHFQNRSSRARQLQRDSGAKPRPRFIHQERPGSPHTLPDDT